MRLIVLWGVITQSFLLPLHVDLGRWAELLLWDAERVGVGHWELPWKGAIWRKG